MEAFTKAIDFAEECTDSMALARAIVSQSNIYLDFYDFDGYTNNRLRAADIYKAQNNDYYEFDCYMNVLNGSVLSHNKAIADSVLALLDKFESLDDNQYQSLIWYKFAYLIEFGTAQDIKDFIDENGDYLTSNIPCLLNLAYGYNVLGRNREALDILDAVRDSGLEYDSLKHEAISVVVLRDLGDYKGALATYRDYIGKMESIDLNKLRHKEQLINAKHALELKAESEARIKSQIIWASITGFVVLLLVIITLIFIIRDHKSQREMANQRAKITDLENSKLRTEREKLTLENINLQLERDKSAAETENLMHRVKILESEREIVLSL